MLFFIFTATISFMEQLFGSKTRVKLLQLFMQNPNRAFYVREITRKIDEQINSVRRELANLLNIGILTSKSKDNRLYYEVDQQYEHYNPLRAVFAGATMDAKKTDVGAGTDQGLADVLRHLGAVELMVYTGRFTGDERAGVDLVIIGNVNRTNVNNFVADKESEEGFEIRYAILTLSEYQYRQSIQDRFISLLTQVKKVVAHDPNGLMTKNMTQATEEKKSKKKGD